MSPSATATNEDGLRNLANQQVARQEWAQATATVQQLTRLSPTSTNYLWLGRVQFNAGQHEEACRSYEQSLALSISRPPSVVADLGRILLKLNKYEEAIRHLTEAQNAGLDDPNVCLLTAALYRELNLFDRALATLRAGAVRYPSDYAIQYNFARELVARGRYREAAAPAERAMEAKAGEDEPKILLSTIRQALKDHRGTVALLQEIANRRLENTQFRVDLYTALEAQHGVHMGVVLDDLCRENPQNLALHLTQVRYLIEQSDFVRAEAALARCANHPKSTSAAFRESQARVALGKGDKTAAAGHFESIWDEIAARRKDKPPSDVQRRNVPVVPLAYFPIEIKGRELAARLLTACFLAQEGFGSVVGATRILMAGSQALPAGLFLHKTMNRIDCLKIERSLPGGHLNVAIDEESLAWTGPDRILATNVDPYILPLLDLALLPGSKTAEAYMSVFADHAHKMRVVGNPRIDLLTGACAPLWKAEVGEIKRRFDSFVLVNTNFATVNSSNFGYAEACSVFLDVTNKPPGSTDFAEVVEMGKSMARSECEYILALEKALLELSESMPETNFILRAHPGESSTRWAQLARNSKNLSMCPPGQSLQAWIRAADAVVYMTGCTTGVEAFLAGVPAIRFETDPTIAFPSYGMSAHMGAVAGNAEELRVLLANPQEIQDEKSATHDRAFVASHISMSEQPSAQRVARELVTLARSRLGPSVPFRDLEDRVATVVELSQASVDRDRKFNRLAGSKRVLMAKPEVDKMIDQFCEIYRLRRPKLMTLTSEAIMIVPAK